MENMKGMESLYGFLLLMSCYYNELYKVTNQFSTNVFLIPREIIRKLEDSKK